MGKSNKFCSPDDFYITLPYRDFEKLALIASKVDENDRRMKRFEEQLDALRSMYIEVLDKIAEIKVYL